MPSNLWNCVWVYGFDFVLQPKAKIKFQRRTPTYMYYSSVHYVARRTLLKNSM